VAKAGLVYWRSFWIVSLSTVNSVCLVAFHMDLRPWMPLWLPWWQSLQSGIQRYWRPCSIWWASEGSDTPQTPQGNDLTRVRWFLWATVSLLFIVYHVYSLTDPPHYWYCHRVAHSLISWAVWAVFSNVCVVIRKTL